MKKISLPKLRLQTKLIVLFFLTIVLPLAIIGPFIYTQQLNSTVSYIQNSNQRELTQLTNRMDLSLSQINSVSKLFYLYKPLNELILTNLQDMYLIESKFNQNEDEINDIIKNYGSCITNTPFKTLIIDNVGRSYGNIAYLDQLDYGEIQNSSWYKSVRQYDFSTEWTTDPYLDQLFSSNAVHYVYSIRRMHNKATWKPHSILIIGIAENDLRNTYSGYLAEHQNLYIMASDGEILSHYDNLGFDNLNLQMPVDEINKISSGSLTQRINNEDYLVTFDTINATGWKVITYTKMSVPLNNLSFIQISFFLLLAVYTIAAILQAVVVSRKFLGPIKGLYNSMALVKSGDLTIQAEVKSHDEISELTEQFNSMVSDIRGLMIQNKKEEEAKRKLELASLQTQINPHFIYNTLASIRYMVYTGDKKKADTIILSLIKLLKNTLSSKEEFITVEKELDLLKSYIDIQQMTFEHPFEVTITIDNDIRNCIILKLVLQPIVENAILHGLKPKKEGGHLTIIGEREGNDILFHIADNGPGIDLEKIQFDPDKILDTRDGIGIQNVHSRVVLHFGKGYGLSIHSNQEEGTRITIRMPYILSDGRFMTYEHFNR